jgi:hypothetical protein
MFLASCWGRNVAYEGGVADTDTGFVATVCGEDADRSKGFAVEGTTLDLGTGGTAAPGLCITAIDPTPAVTGKDPELLAASTICDDGNFVITGVETDSQIGIFVIIDDCEGQPDTVMRTATGIPPEDIAGLGDGGTLAGVEAQLVTLERLATQQADLEAVGWTGDLGAAGYMAGIVEDAAGAPVAGATVGCGACGFPVYYQDGDGTDGLYAVGDVANTSTVAEGDAAFMIPDAPIYTYACDDGGAHTWDTTLLGSLDAYAVYIRFTAL